MTGFCLMPWYLESTVVWYFYELFLMPGMVSSQSKPAAAEILPITLVSVSGVSLLVGLLAGGISVVCSCCKPFSATGLVSRGMLGESAPLCLLNLLCAVLCGVGGGRCTCAYAFGLLADQRDVLCLGVCQGR